MQNYLLASGLNNFHLLHYHFTLFLLFLSFYTPLKILMQQLLEDSVEERLEKTLLADPEKAEGETKEGESEENKVSSMLIPVQCYWDDNALHYIQ